MWLDNEKIFSFFSQPNVKGCLLKLPFSKYSPKGKTSKRRKNLPISDTLTGEMELFVCVLLLALVYHSCKLKFSFLDCVNCNETWRGGVS